MIASCNSFHTPSTDHLQTRFLTLLPRIENCARFHFRGRRCASGKADAIAETVALCWKWFCRLAQGGKDMAAFLPTLVSFAARSVKTGRRLCGQERARDVLSFRAQQRGDFTVESLPLTPARSRHVLEDTLNSRDELDGYADRLRDNTQTPVPDQAAFRIDWPRFFKTLSSRDRRLAGFLSLVNSALAAARKFGLSPGRVTQLRQKWCRDWRALEDEDSSTAPGELESGAERLAIA
jgi:hypothetical protein